MIKYELFLSFLVFLQSFVLTYPEIAFLYIFSRCSTTNYTNPILNIFIGSSSQVIISSGPDNTNDGSAAKKSGTKKITQRKKLGSRSIKMQENLMESCVEMDSRLLCALLTVCLSISLIKNELKLTLVQMISVSLTNL